MEWQTGQGLRQDPYTSIDCCGLHGCSLIDSFSARSAAEEKCVAATKKSVMWLYGFQKPGKQTNNITPNV